MRAFMLGVLMVGCASSRGVPREAEGTVRCFDGDALTDGVAVCETYIAIRAGGCSLPRAVDLGCAGGTFCATHDCFEAPVCSARVTLDGCEDLAAACAELGETDCVAPFDVETGEIGPVE